MTAIWPASLPDVFPIDGYQETFGSNVITTQMETGPAKKRRRSTAQPLKMSGEMLMTAMQYRTFQGFYRTTLMDGVKAFLFPDRLGGPDQLSRFTGPPSVRRSGPQWLVSMEIEVLP